MNLRGSRPSATASDRRYSIIDEVVGLSFLRHEIHGKVTASNSSHTNTPPASIRKRIFVQYHIDRMQNAECRMHNPESVSYYALCTVHFALVTLCTMHYELCIRFFA